MDRLECLLCERRCTFAEAQGRLVYMPCRHVMCVDCVGFLIAYRRRACPFCRERLRWTKPDLDRYVLTKIT